LQRLNPFALREAKGLAKPPAIGHEAENH
jgi:hypothetical protein